MKESFQRKNYYFLQTMLKEMEQYDVISFNLYDTLLLRNVLFPRDIWKLLGKSAEAKYGIVDFHYVRENIENELRYANGPTVIRFSEIYAEIGRRYPEWPVEALMDKELQLEKTYVVKNPLLDRIFQAAVAAGKKVLIVADTVFSQQFVQELLSQCGYSVSGTEIEVYLSSEYGVTKESGDLYQRILTDDGFDPARWLHIGTEPRGDLEIPRQMHLTAAAYRCPRDGYFEDRAEAHSKAEEQAGTTLPQEPLDTSVEFSVETGTKLNEDYVQTLEPKEEVVIQVDHVSMMFNMAAEKVDSMKEYIIRLLKRQLTFQEFWALKDVSFTVKKGEKVGLIGLNGSGKSTMLKIVSGVMKPTRGKVGICGTTAPLIELGAGFDLELSARENVYLNGAILGYSREDMVTHYRDIMDFAELWDFENVAIKNFSSGMIARLGFAIATCHVPDILIIDEILSVGDYAFQKKCHRKMQELTQRGATVLFVSHSAGDVINMCDRAIWLDHGRMIHEGQAQFIVEKYMNQ